MTEVIFTRALDDFSGDGQDIALIEIGPGLETRIGRLYNYLKPANPQYRYGAMFKWGAPGLGIPANATITKAKLEAEASRASINDWDGIRVHIPRNDGAWDDSADALHREIVFGSVIGDGVDLLSPTLLPADSTKPLAVFGQGVGYGGIDYNPDDPVTSVVQFFQCTRTGQCVFHHWAVSREAGSSSDIQLQSHLWTVVDDNISDIGGCVLESRIDTTFGKKVSILDDTPGAPLLNIGFQSSLGVGVVAGKMYAIELTIDSTLPPGNLVYIWGQTASAGDWPWSFNLLFYPSRTRGVPNGDGLFQRPCYAAVSALPYPHELLGDGILVSNVEQTVEGTNWPSSIALDEVISMGNGYSSIDADVDLVSLIQAWIDDPLYDPTSSITLSISALNPRIFGIQSGLASFYSLDSVPSFPSSRSMELHITYTTPGIEAALGFTSMEAEPVLDMAKLAALPIFFADEVTDAVPALDFLRMNSDPVLSSILEAEVVLDGKLEAEPKE